MVRRFDGDAGAPDEFSDDRAAASRWQRGRLVDFSTRSPWIGRHALSFRLPLSQDGFLVTDAHGISIVTGHGSDVMWQGYASTWTPSDVVSPP